MYMYIINPMVYAHEFANFIKRMGATNSTSTVVN